MAIENNLLVSIVLTTYKRSHLLLNAVDSVLGGSYGNFEIIIVNDCSPDDTDDVVCTITDPRVRYLKLDKNAGVLAARNRGFDAATGELIAILDDDDILLPDALEQVVRSYCETPPQERGIFWFDCRDKESGRKSGVMMISGEKVSFEEYVCGKVRGDFWLVFDSRVLRGERFDERLRAHESLFWLKLHRLFPARYCPVVVCEKFREHGERLCDLQTRLRHLPQIVLALEEFITQFGEDLKRISPREYGKRLAYLGLHQLMTGASISGRSAILASMRFRFSAKYLCLYILSFMAGPDFIRKLYVMSEQNS